MTQTLFRSDVSDLADARRAALRPALLLASALVALSAAMIVFLSGASVAGAGIDSPIWIRSSFALGSALVVLILTLAAAGGSRGAWVRLRIVSSVVVVAVIVIVSIPGFLPDWVRIEQAMCGLLLLPIAILVNRPRARALFSAKA